MVFQSGLTAAQLELALGGAGLFEDGGLAAEEPQGQPILEELKVDVSGQSDLLHHNVVHTLEGALGLSEGEQLAAHEDDQVEFVSVVLEVDGHRGAQQVATYFLVAPPLG